MATAGTTAEKAAAVKAVESAAAFKGGCDWRRRFRARWGISIRKKTNVKNSTWEQTKPILQRYFRALRRRVTLSDDELAQYAIAASPAPPATTPNTVIRGKPYVSVEDVEIAISQWQDPDGLCLMPDMYPDTETGNAALDAALRRAQYASKLDRLAATPCNSDDWKDVEAVWARRVVLRAKSLLAAAATPATPAPTATAAVVPAERLKYGRYLPHQRGNVDQVPLPFVNDMDVTYEMKGAKRVAINQLGPALSKRQATGQVCFRPEPPPPPRGADAAALQRYRGALMEQPPPCIVMRGLGNVKQSELDAYPTGLVVLWQPKAWVDRPVALAWAKACWQKMIEADVTAGVANASTRYLLFQDNLDAQRPDRNPEYTKLLSEQCNTDSHMLPPNKTDEVQPVDDGMGRQIKCYMGQEEDGWLEDDDNLEKWEANALTASDRRVLIATWFFKVCLGN